MRVLAIGLNKTGTMSFNSSMNEFGFKTHHGPYRFNSAINKARGENKKILTYLNVNAYSDIFFPVGMVGNDKIDVMMSNEYRFNIIKQIDEEYPGTKFILNVRDIDCWLNSREKHVKKNQQNLSYSNKSGLRWVNIDRTGWLKEFNDHTKTAREFFKNRENDFIELDFTLNDYGKMCDFLKIKPKRDKFKHINKG